MHGMPSQPIELFCSILGELIIWTLANELSSRVASYGSAEGGHCDSINHLNWLTLNHSRSQSYMNHEHHLVTFGGDGHIICWRLSMNQSSGKAGLEVVKVWDYRINKVTYSNLAEKPFTHSRFRYRVTGQDQIGSTTDDLHAPRMLSNSFENGYRPLGISCAVFSPHSDDNLLIGTDSGDALLATFQVSDWTVSQAGKEELIKPCISFLILGSGSL